MRRALAVLAAAALLLGGCSAGTVASASAGGTGNAVSLVESRCTRCHGTQRIKLAQHDEGGWRVTIARMRGHGAQLTDAEAAALVTYLAAHSKVLP